MTDLERRRNDTLRPRGAAIVRSPKDAERFVDRCGIVLRYGSGKTLPLASMFDATSGGAPNGPYVRAAELTNHLLGAGLAIEVSVVAGRLALVHRSLAPAVYALVRRGRRLDDLDGLGLDARRALALLQTRREVSVGDVRACLGVTRSDRIDPGYEALAELARVMLVDRGPYEINPKGIHYLSKDGYPHHLFHAAHPELVRAAGALSPAEAADTLLDRYLRGAAYCAVPTMKSMFKALVTAGELDAALERLVAAGVLTIDTIAGRRSAVRVEKGKRR
jgi:hypothetical protein